MPNDNGMITAIIFNIISIIGFILFLAYDIVNKKTFTLPTHKIAYPMFFFILIIFSIVFGMSYKSIKDNESDDDKKNAKMYLGLLIANGISFIPIIMKFYFYSRH